MTTAPVVTESGAILGLDDPPRPWAVVRVGDGIHHLVDANGLTLLSSTSINGRGPDLQKQLLERICACMNALDPEVVALAACVFRHDQAHATGTKRFQASALLAHHVVKGAESL
jgi:hypothetical protein